MKRQAPEEVPTESQERPSLRAPKMRPRGESSQPTTLKMPAEGDPLAALTGKVAALVNTVDIHDDWIPKLQGRVEELEEKVSSLSGEPPRVIVQGPSWRITILAAAGGLLLAGLACAGVIGAGVCL